jgi:hypothetical protein
VPIGQAALEQMCRLPFTPGGRDAHPRAIELELAGILGDVLAEAGRRVR